MKDEMRSEYDFSKGVRGKHAKDMLAGYTVQVTGQATDQATGQATGQVPEEVRRLMLILKGEMKRTEIQEMLGLRHHENFRDNYLLPALDAGIVEMIFPENPKHPKQAYRLSKKGKALKRSLKAKDKKS